ncbi:MAG TPA: SCO family protein [Terriglobales bacterium]|nr:SCO family protein [Terriglobales bacterium]
MLLATGAAGQAMRGGGILAPPANQRPPGLNNVGIEQRLNEQIPADLTFRDETGNAVRLGDYFGGKPIILDLAYFRCQMLCPEVLSGLTVALRGMKFDVGREFEVLTISFDPRETPATAAEAKQKWLARYGRKGAEQGWHFLTGQQEAIAALTKAAGFQYKYDPNTQQFAHTTAIMVLTPQGKIAQYYYGVEFSPKDLRLALVEASHNKIGNLADAILLYCYHYDPATGRYGAVIMRVLRLAGLATMIFLGSFIALMLRRDAVSSTTGRMN